MQLDALSNKSMNWLHQNLPSNPRLTSQVDNEVVKFMYKPPHKIKNRNNLTSLLKKYHSDGKGALLLSELSDSIPNAAKFMESLGSVVIDVPTQVTLIFQTSNYSSFFSITNGVIMLTSIMMQRLTTRLTKNSFHCGAARQLTISARTRLPST